MRSSVESVGGWATEAPVRVAEVHEGRGHVRVRRAELALVDGQRALQELQLLSGVPQVPVRIAKVHQRRRDLRLRSFPFCFLLLFLFFSFSFRRDLRLRSSFSNMF